jgi:hypothetical protein
MQPNSSSADKPPKDSAILDIHNPEIPLPSGAIFDFRPVRWLRKDLSVPTPETSSTQSKSSPRQDRSR